jgi:threonine synthase
VRTGDGTRQRYDVPSPIRLRCRACGGATADTGVQYCDRCFGPLELVPPVPVPTRAEIEAGPRSMWRYAPLLAHADGLHAGWTRLVPAPWLGTTLGLERLWLKLENENPTGSFKDRLVATAVAASPPDAVLACASTGNLARAVLRAAEETGRGVVVLVPAGTDVPGAIEVAGGYDAVNRLAVEASMVHGEWAWVNVGRRAFYVEGAATLAYETVEQLGWRAPEHVVAPIASGASLLRMARAFEELAPLLDRAPHVRVSAAQPEGCAPVARAFEAGDDDVRPVRASTTASSLAMGDPPDGPDLLAAVRRSGGVVEAVPEDEIAGGVRLLADTEGVATEPAGGVVVAALRRLVERGVVARDEEVVLYVTAGRPGMPTGSVGVPIEPRIEALEAALPDHVRKS